MLHRWIFLLSLLLAPFAAGSAKAGLTQAESRPLPALAETLRPLNNAGAAAALPADPGGGPAAEPGLPGGLLIQKTDGLNENALMPDANESAGTELDFSFGDDEEARPLDGGLNKDTGAALVGLRHNFSDNWHLGGGALFQGRGRGAAAKFGFSW